MPVRKKSTKIPKAIWVVFQLNVKGDEPPGVAYADPNEIGKLSDDEVVAHYHLAKGK